MQQPYPITLEQNPPDSPGKPPDLPYQPPEPGLPPVTPGGPVSEPPFAPPVTDVPGMPIPSPISL